MLRYSSRRGRALLDWNQHDLASESGRHQLNVALGELARAYQRAGLVLFFEDDNGGVGVREKKASAD